jgi:hypothetical protein
MALPGITNANAFDSAHDLESLLAGDFKKVRQCWCCEVELRQLKPQLQSCGDQIRQRGARSIGEEGQIVAGAPVAGGCYLDSFRIRSGWRRPFASNSILPCPL